MISNKELVNKILLKANKIKYSSYHPDDTIKFEGDPIDELGFIISGKLKIINYTYLGEEKYHSQLKENYIVPIYYYLMDIKEYKNSLKAVTNLEIAWIPINEINKIFLENPDIVIALTMQLAKRGHYNNHRIRCFNYQKVRERIIYWLLVIENGELNGIIDVPITKTLLAEELHVSRSSLSRELSKMKDEGLIGLDGNKITILDIDKLEKKI